MQDLEMRLRNDLSKIGLNVDFTLSLRPYSKSYFGRYDINSSTVIVYVQKTPNGEMYSYEDILLTTIHEAIHCLQWHNPEFKRLYALYSNRAKARVLFKEVISRDCFCKASGRQSYDYCGLHC